MSETRGIRGAITIATNSPEAILDGAKELLLAMVGANDLAIDQIAAVFFTLTPDLNAEFPAYAARKLGWNGVPMLCATEVPVPGAMCGVLRILMLVNMSVSQSTVHHQYLGEAAALRPDLARSQS